MSEVSFEKKLEQAKEYLKKLSDPDITIEKSIEFHKKGLKLLNQAQDKLEDAKLKFKEEDQK
ncbi:MAG: exodeoxyribonuclease VII small subunit [Campylobacteraceae bacterium 4484_166]|nr:MAG: exodeoxyribonuclease VII small subunit [Campylobacteraceae bacterium 4484_166]